MSSVCSMVTASLASPSSGASFCQSRMKRMSLRKSVPLSRLAGGVRVGVAELQAAPEQSPVPRRVADRDDAHDRLVDGRVGHPVDHRLVVGRGWSPPYCVASSPAGRALMKSAAMDWGVFRLSCSVLQGRERRAQLLQPRDQGGVRVDELGLDDREQVVVGDAEAAGEVLQARLLQVGQRGGRRQPVEVAELQRGIGEQPVLVAGDGELLDQDVGPAVAGRGRRG